MSRSLDTLLAASAPAIWGSTYLVTTEALPEGYPVTLAALRALPAGLFLLAFVAARRILACLYGTIAAASGVALLAKALGWEELFIAITLVLFSMQIVYKLATWPAVGLGSPVVRANLAISALHAVSLAVLFSSHQGPI